MNEPGSTKYSNVVHATYVPTNTFTSRLTTDSLKEHTSQTSRQTSQIGSRSKSGQSTGTIEQEVFDEEFYPSGGGTPRKPEMSDPEVPSHRGFRRRRLSKTRCPCWLPLTTLPLPSGVPQWWPSHHPFGNKRCTSIPGGRTGIFFHRIVSLGEPAMGENTAGPQGRTFKGLRREGRGGEGRAPFNIGTTREGVGGTTKGMAWPASPVATGCQGNPCSTGIRSGVSPAAQMGCLRNRSGGPSGADQP